MDRTAWDEEVALGYESMDREHGMQVQLLGALEEALSTGAAPAASGEILARLLDFSDVHFGSEELLMRLHSYPRYGLHVEEHRRLVAQLDEIKERHQRGEPATDLVRELRRWLVGHIGGMDRDFAEHAASGGAPRD